MATDKKELSVYKDGTKRPYFVKAENVNFGTKESPEFLPEKLGEIDEALENAVYGVKVGEDVYSPDENGVVDLSTPMADKVDKETGKGLSSNDYTTQERNKLAGLSNYDDTALQAAVVSLQNALAALVGGADVQGAIDTFNEVVAFLSGISSSDTLAAKLATLVPQERTINGKPLSANVVIGMSDIQGLVDAINNAGSGAVSVSVPDPADGTFTIHVGSTDYVINLNHTHPEYAPLVHTHSQYAQVMVVNGESNLPATLDPKTIYGVKADGVDELEMVVIGGYKFYGGGGGAPGQPVLMKPDAGSTIVISGVDNGYSGNVLDPKSVQVYIKARYITQPISVSVSGTGFSIENNVNQIAAADAIAGVNINVLFDGSANSQGGTLLLQSTELGQVPRAFDIEVEYVTYELLDSVETDGRQWAKSSSKINTAVTKVEMDVQFSTNGNTTSTASTGCGILSSYSTDTPSSMADAILAFYSGQAGAGNTAGSYAITFITNGSNKYNNVLQQLKFHQPNSPDATFLQRSIISFTPGASNATVAFNGNSATAGKADATSVSDTYIGLKPHTADDVPFNKFNMKIYNIKFTENQIVVHNFVPVLREDVAGLYDTVTDEFIVSETGTDFIAHHISNNS